MAWRVRNPWSAEDEAKFFDLIAEGSTIRAAAYAVGKSRGAGAGRFDRAKKVLGRQAS